MAKDLFFGTGSKLYGGNYELIWPFRIYLTYYITNDLKMTVKTFLTCLNDRWLIEQNHRDLKQLCGLKTMFVRKRQSVQGLIALSYLVKNFLILCLAEAGLSIRNYPLESLIEKEFTLLEQDLINQALRMGVMENWESQSTK